MNFETTLDNYPKASKLGVHYT